MSDAYVYHITKVGVTGTCIFAYHRVIDSLTEHLVLRGGVRIVQMQEELLEEGLQMSNMELGLVFFVQTGQPQPERLEGGAAHLLAAVVQPLQQLCGEKTPAGKIRIHWIG